MNVQLIHALSLALCGTIFALFKHSNSLNAEVKCKSNMVGAQEVNWEFSFNTPIGFHVYRRV